MVEETDKFSMRLRKEHKNSKEETWSAIIKRYKIEKECLCSKCNNERRLELDHIIPISCGGSNEDYNLQLLCRWCHKEKTIIDKMIIHLFKKIGLIEIYYQSEYHFKVNKKELSLIYSYLYQNSNYKREW